MKTNKPVQYKLGYILIFIFLLCSPPFVFELFPFMPGWKVLYILVFPFLFVYSIKYNPFKCLDYKLLFAWILVWLLYALVQGDSVYVSRIFVAIISLFLLALIKSFGNEMFSNIYVRLILFMAILGTVVFLLVFLTGFSPVFEYENADGRPGYCFLLTCSNSYTAAIGTIRYSGFFDEPGAMGLWGSFALLLNKLTKDNKKIELLLIIFLCFTFSVGFYLTLFLYVIFFLLKKKSIGLFIVLALIGGICATYLLENDNIYRMTLGRLAYDSSTGTFVGNNRHEQQDYAIQYFQKFPLCGVGATETLELKKKGIDLGDNVFSPLAKDGILGVLAIYLPFFICAFRCRRNPTAIKCLIIVFASFFHRSITFTVYNIVMYLFFLEMIYRDTYRARSITLLKNSRILPD